MKIMGLVMFVMLMFGTVAAVDAQPGAPPGEIRARIHEIDRRINQGIERGAITRNEARSLKGELNGIRMRSERRLGPRGRDRINVDLDRLNDRLRREMRDYDRRGPGPGPRPRGN